MKRALLLGLLAAGAASGPACSGDKSGPNVSRGGSGGRVDACGLGGSGGSTGAGGGGGTATTGSTCTVGTVPTGCADGLVCLDHVCASCTGDAQCGRVSLQCDPNTSACRFRTGWGSECCTHVDCPAGDLCVQGLCQRSRPDIFCGGLGQCPRGERCNRPLDVCEEDLGCHADVDCLDTEVCNTATQKCEPRCTKKTEGDVCTGLQHCNDHGRCVECETDDQCGANSGLHCNVDAGQCVAEGFCFVDSECPAGQVCHFATRTCVAQLPPCLSDNECPLGDRCDLASGKCIAGDCVIDQYEPNDTREQAAQLLSEMVDLTLCPGNEDWFKVALAQGDQVSITIEADVLASDRGVDATLEDSLGRVLDRNPFTVSGTAQVAGEYYLRVRPLAGQRLDYGLTYVRAAGEPCADDVYEDNETAAEAKPLTPGPTIGLRLCAADPDFYVVAVPTGKTVRVTLTHDPSKGLIQLLLLDSDGRTLLGADPDKATQTVQGRPSAGRAYVQVTSNDPAIQNGYELEVTVE